MRAPYVRVGAKVVSETVAESTPDFWGAVVASQLRPGQLTRMQYKKNWGLASVPGGPLPASRVTRVRPG